MGSSLAIDGGTPVRTEPFEGPGHEFGDADIDAVAEVLRAELKTNKRDEFEQAFAARHGAQYGVTTNSGTSSMHTCVAAINPEPGDEIIVTPWTSGGSIIGLLFQNCVPVFADIDDTYTLDPKDVETKITDRTKAILGVHLFGNPCDMQGLRDVADRHNLYLIEDCCQAHLAEFNGKTVGSLGDIAGFSFGGKHLSVAGGGMVTTNKRELWERAILFRDMALPRDNGPLEGKDYANYFLAPNYKINEMMCAVLLTQLEKLDGYIERKITAANYIMDGVSDIPEIVPQKIRPGDRHTHWSLGFTIDTEALGIDAFHFADATAAEGVPFGGPYIGSGRFGPLYKNPFLADPACYGRSRFPFDHNRDGAVDYTKSWCPYGEELMGRSIATNMRPSFTQKDLDDAVASLRKVAVHYRNRK